MLILSIAIGIALGIITGLTPGLHINTLSSAIASNISYISLLLNPLEAAVVIASMSTTHTFLDAIPSTFLGAPESSTALSVLPAHKMLMDGQGREAVALTLIGSLGALLLSSASMPYAIIFLPKAYALLKNYLAPIMIAAGLSIIMIGEKRRILALFVFLLSGMMGYFALNSNIPNPLFPLLSGFFGASTLILSIKNKSSIPEQNDKLKATAHPAPIILSALCGWLCALLPGVGSAHAATIGSLFCKNNKKPYKEDIHDSGKNFLVMTGGINTSAMLLSFASLYAMNKKRNGSAVAIASIVHNLSMQDLTILISASLISGCTAVIIALKLTDIFIKALQKLDYCKVCTAIIFGIATACIFLSGIYGIIVFASSTLMGIAVQTKQIKRSSLMGSIIIPVIIYFL